MAKDPSDATEADDSDDLWAEMPEEEVDLVTLPSICLTSGLTGPSHGDEGDPWPDGRHSAFGSLTGGRQSHDLLDHQFLAKLKREYGR